MLAGLDNITLVKGGEYFFIWEGHRAIFKVDYIKDGVVHYTYLPMSHWWAQRSYSNSLQWTRIDRNAVHIYPFGFKEYYNAVNREK